MPDESLRKSLEGYHKKFRSEESIDAEVLKEYEILVKNVLKHLIDG